MDRNFQPTRFGRYLLTERIAIGGMAEILNAKVQGAMGFEKPVVIKRILPQHADDIDFLRMFITEAKLVCHLEHPNIVQVQELGEINGQYYIAMDFVNGIDGRVLWRTMARRQQRLPGILALYIVSEFLKGLDYAHRAVGPDGQLLGVVHRDVSPANVLISFRGDVKIGDFGIARVEQESDTQSGVLKGKYGYMSPEQVAGMKVDHRSDIFAAGIVLAELVLGRRLFMGRSDFETLDRVMNVRLDVLEESESALPPDVVEIIRRALQREVTDRYQSARDFNEAIVELLYARKERISNETLAAFIAKHVVPVLKQKDFKRGNTVETAPAQPPPIHSPVVPSGIVPKHKELATSAPSTVREKTPTRELPMGTVREVSLKQLAESQDIPLFTNNDDGSVVSSYMPKQPAAPDPRFGDGPVFEVADGDLDDEISQVSIPDPQDMGPGPILIVDSSQSYSGEFFGEELELGSDDEKTPAARPIRHTKSPGVLVNRTLEAPGREGVEASPDFTGQLHSRTVAKILFRFSMAEENGLLSINGPACEGPQADLIFWLRALGAQVGAPWCTERSTDARTCEIHFSEGRPHLASADRSEEGLVAFLIRTGRLSQDKIEREVRQNPKRKLVAALLSGGLIAPLGVTRHVTAYVLESILETFSWTSGNFAFYKDRECSSDAFPTGLDAIQLISRGVANLQEYFLEEYFNNISSFTLVPNHSPPVWIGSFNPDEVLLKIYRSLGTCRSVNDSLSRGSHTAGSPLRAMQLIYMLLECDMAMLRED